jgi:hypothetical protein
MKIEVLADAAAVAQRAAQMIGDVSIPAGRIQQDQAVLVADRAAARTN